MQMKYVDKVEKLYGESMNIVLMPLLPFEVKGIEAIGEVEKLLFPNVSSG
jgi:hypothetical protein